MAEEVRCRRGLRLGLIVLLLFGLTYGCQKARRPGAEAKSDLLVVSGKILNKQGKGIKNVHVTIMVNGKVLPSEEELNTSHDGTFETEAEFPPGTLKSAKVEVLAERTTYRPYGPTELKLSAPTLDKEGRNVYLAHVNTTLPRTTSPALWIATTVLILVYALIALEFFHRTLAALLGATIMLGVTYLIGTFNHGYFILSFEEAIQAIDMNVILLLMAMMIIVGVTKKTGVFQWLAYKSYQLAKGNVYFLAVILMFVTAVTSAFLDNVTTMLLIIPVTIQIALVLKIDPVAFLIPEVFASNVGGTATLIGDPPNIMIGSYAKLSFVNFVQNLTLVNLVGLIIASVYFVYWFKRDYLKAEVGDTEAMIASLREEYKITDQRLLIYCLVILAITVSLFVFHGLLHMEPSIAALIGAALLLTISRVDIVEMLEHEIEWPTLIFFMMLFIVVAGAEQTGLIQIIADWVRELSKGSLVAAILMVLWVSALASAIIDNIPFTATMLPIVAYLTQVIPGAESGVLWWALALGACLGGNGTMIGASANVVTVGMAERAGHPISFMHYFKMCFFPMILTVVLCSAWLLIFMR